MKIPLQITIRDIPASDALEARIRKKAAKLEEFHPRITRCRVMVEEARKHWQETRGGTALGAERLRFVDFIEAHFAGELAESVLGAEVRA